MKERIPLWLAVAITVAIATPFAFHLGIFNIPLWLSFIVWAEYFALGANPSALKPILIGFPIGAFDVVLWLLSTLALVPIMGVELGFIVSNFVWVSLVVYILRYNGLGKATLAIFNGLSMTLAIFFTNSIPQGLTTNPYLVTVLAGVWAIVAGYFGAFLGWFNVVITFPRPVKK